MARSCRPEPTMSCLHLILPTNLKEPKSLLPLTIRRIRRQRIRLIHQPNCIVPPKLRAEALHRRTNSGRPLEHGLHNVPSIDRRPHPIPTKTQPRRRAQQLCPVQRSPQHERGLAGDSALVAFPSHGGSAQRVPDVERGRARGGQELGNAIVTSEAAKRSGVVVRELGVHTVADGAADVLSLLRCNLGCWRESAQRRVSDGVHSISALDSQAPVDF
mmetsp:Transcript_2244/g.5539  ORF Transcript_2244/g.5539 Transcript_2244/m.5539 type:complete len:216 (-) Transcript_2244:1231-1878(-)